jgi:hypothetical protein
MTLAADTAGINPAARWKKPGGSLGKISSAPVRSLNMGFASFLSQLFEHGRVHVTGADEMSHEELAEARKQLTEFERAWRETLPGSAPEFLMEPALWSAQTVYRACQSLVYREWDAGRALRCSTAAPRGTRTAAMHYSVDLAMRFLPDVWRLARTAAEGDALGSKLLELAGDWPLSSVGIPGVSASSIDGIAQSECLLALYVDRILERKDRSRLDDPRIRSAAQAAIGLFKDIALL